MERNLVYPSEAMTSAIVEYEENQAAKLRVLEQEDFPGSTIPALHASVELETGETVRVRNTGTRRDMESIVSQYECDVLELEDCFARKVLTALLCALQRNDFFEHFADGKLLKMTYNPCCRGRG